MCFQRQNQHEWVLSTSPQDRFQEQVITEFETLGSIDELYILGDFNIKLLYKDICILNNPTKLKNSTKIFLLT